MLPSNDKSRRKNVWEATQHKVWIQYLAHDVYKKNENPGWHSISSRDSKGNNDEKRLLRWIPCKLEYFHAFYTRWMCVINVRKLRAPKRYIKAENRFVKQTYLNEPHPR